MTSYGDYGKPSLPTRESQSTGTKKTNSQSELKSSDPKASEISQKIFGSPTELLALSKRLDDLHVEFKQHGESSTSNTSEAKTNSIGKPLLGKINKEINQINHQLIQTDLQRKEAESHLNSNPISKIDLMNEDELIEAMSNPEFSEEELDRILLRLEEFETKSLYEKTIYNEGNIIESNKTDKFLKLSEAKEIQIDNKLRKLDTKHALFLDKTGQAKKLEHADLKQNPNRIISFDQENGQLKLSKEMLTSHNFKVGQFITVTDEKGISKQVEIKEIKVLTKEELESFRNDFLIQNNLPQLASDKTPQDETLQARPYRNQASQSTTKPTSTTIKNLYKTEVIFPQIQILKVGRSIRKQNEERIKKFNERMEKKIELLRREVQTYELKTSTIKIQSQKSEVLSQSVKNTTVQILQLKQMIQTIRDNADKIEIPLSVMEKIDEIETSFIQIARIIPRQVDGVEQKIPEVLMETIALQKQVTKIVSDIVKTNGLIVKSTSGRGGKTSATGA